jgi:hypothetical protein
MLNQGLDDAAMGKAAAEQQRTDNPKNDGSGFHADFLLYLVTQSG